MPHYNLPHLKKTYGCQPTLAGAAKRKPVTDYIQQAHTGLGTEKALYVRNSETDILAAHRGRVNSGVLRRDHLADIEPSTTPTFEVWNLQALVERLAVAVQELK
jgi:phosphoglycolate phosphatase-like HAD superfamily hydrolase